MIIISGIAQITPEKLRYDTSGNIEYIKFDIENKTNDRDSPTSSDSFWKDILHEQSQNEFIVKNKFERNDGSYYEHYRQFYNGIAVEDGIYILHFRNGRIEKANGHYVDVNELITYPELTPEEASESYAKYLQVQDSTPKNFMHELVIAEIEKTLDNKKVYSSHLCYKINFLDPVADNGEIGYIDAQTGNVLKTIQENEEYSDTGTFSTLYSGNRSAVTQYYNEIFNLCDSSRNAIIHTWDLNNTNYEYYLINREEFTDNNNVWTANEHSSYNDQMALDIHWALQGIYDYFDEGFGLQGFNGLDSAISAYVHAEKPDGNRDNAWYNPSYDAFFFGDGDTFLSQWVF